ncbi:hypothetical protein RA307_10650 [Xanthobacteraceae bacterium Astr-EGSB]|uniref:hypothetical protein n=1 Tax=Astrobacterium formosum TaxID=3069710 RepID=UPI0027AE0D0E|nr:hypothetical protein [Xanthobacteraceae bacterium Astr-EGSB]
MPERGDLLLVPFPFIDLSATKRRPVLALTATDVYGDFIALPVASRPRAEHGSDAPIAIEFVAQAEQLDMACQFDIGFAQDANLEPAIIAGAGNACVRRGVERRLCRLRTPSSLR